MKKDVDIFLPLLTEGCEREQAELEHLIPQLEADLNSYDDSAAKFLELIRRYKEFAELTPAMLHEFVDRIEIHERADRRAIVTTQSRALSSASRVRFSLLHRFHKPMEHCRNLGAGGFAFRVKQIVGLAADDSSFLHGFDRAFGVAADVCVIVKGVGSCDFG